MPYKQSVSSHDPNNPVRLYLVRLWREELECIEHCARIVLRNLVYKLHDLGGPETGPRQQMGCGNKMKASEVGHPQTAPETKSTERQYYESVPIQ